jgi:hypothetical protein
VDSNEFWPLPLALEAMCYDDADYLDWVDRRMPEFFRQPHELMYLTVFYKHEVMRPLQAPKMSLDEAWTLLRASILRGTIQTREAPSADLPVKLDVSTTDFELNINACDWLKLFRPKADLGAVHAKAQIVGERPESSRKGVGGRKPYDRYRAWNVLDTLFADNGALQANDPAWKSKEQVVAELQVKYPRNSQEKAPERTTAQKMVKDYLAKNPHFEAAKN